MAADGISKGKRRDVVTLWMRQLWNLHQRQGTSKPAAGGWIGAVYALRAASRLDGNKEWGKLGDEIISHLEQAYLAVLGPDAAKGVEVGRELLQTKLKPEAPQLEGTVGSTDHAEVVANLRRAAGARLGRTAAGRGKSAAGASRGPARRAGGKAAAGARGRSGRRGR
jgi:hypothetical protein